ncbi:MAG: type II toxin-antitoxin system RelE/ParE family toxin [Paludibacter sp.]
MALEIFWSKQADKRFDFILNYLEEKWGEHTTSLFVKKVYDIIGIIAIFPEICTVEQINSNIRGLVVIKQISIFYQIRDNKIIILNFYDNRQLPKVKKF